MPDLTFLLSAGQLPPSWAYMVDLKSARLALSFARTWGSLSFSEVRKFVKHSASTYHQDTHHAS